MADRAVKAIKAFFDRYDKFGTPEVCAAYTTWVVPEPEECINENGQKLLSCHSYIHTCGRSLMKVTLNTQYATFIHI